MDEAGLYRLQQALDGNRTKAAQVQAAFAAALSAVDEFSASLKDFAFRPDMLRLPEAVPLRILPDLEEADAAAADFVERLSALRPSISANASGITAAVANAVSRARSLVAGLNLSIKFTPVVGDPETEGEEPIALGTGGRISRPTFAHIAEEGDPEYVIPVRNDSRAVPLLQQLFGELSNSAKETLFGSSIAAVDKAPLSKGSWPEGPEGIATPDLSALRADLVSTNLSTITNNSVITNHDISAPVNITVTSTGPTAEAVGKTVYNAAERALVRTLEGVFA